MKQVFISDLHLEPERQDITTAFLHFLENKAESADELYILGDFFEVWVGDDFSNEFVENIKSVLKTYSDKGLKIFIMHGNRDFLIGEDFCQQSGATLLPEQIILNQDHEPILVMHGDELCTRDIEYMKTRELFRSEAFKVDFLSKPLEERIAIARSIRNESMGNKADKTMDIMDVTPDEVIKIMSSKNVKFLLHGHTHRPQIHRLNINGEECQRIVLSDWDGAVSYLEIDNGAISFQKFAS